MREKLLCGLRMRVLESWRKDGVVQRTLDGVCPVFVALPMFVQGDQGGGGLHTSIEGILLRGIFETFLCFRAY